jgi:hypothetical protein
MRLRRAVGVALVLAGLLGLGGAFALADSGDEDADADEFSASHLGDGMGEGSLWEMLSPEEKAAAEKSGVPWLDDDKATAKAGASSEGQSDNMKKLDKAGKVGFSLLAVGLSLAAAAAPFLLF